MNQVELENDQYAYIRVNIDPVLSVTFNEAGRRSITGLIDDLFPDACLYADRGIEFVDCVRGREERTTLFFNNLDRWAQESFYLGVRKSMASHIVTRDFGNEN